VTQSALLLSATNEMVVAPGIANIHRHDPLTLAQAEKALNEAFPGRFVLGLGVGSKHFTEARGKRWESPIATMRDYLHAMDAAPFTGVEPAAPPRRVLAALGPRMLELAAAHTWGAHPYFLPLEHTAWARQIVGPDALLAVHQSVVPHRDRAEAREIARRSLATWLELRHFVPSRWQVTRELLNLDDSDLAGGGSDRLVDAMIAYGDVETVAKRVREQFDAGADHVCISVITTGEVTPPLAMDRFRELAPALRES
jgi:probable F420-dependent oxidoreductase